MSAKMYRSAVEWMEESGKDALAGDVFRSAIEAVVLSWGFHPYILWGDTLFITFLTWGF